MMLLWKMTKLAGLGVAVLAVLYLIANAGLVAYTGARLEERLQAVRDAGDPVSLKDLARKEKLPPEKNAATYLRRARDDAAALSRELAILPYREDGRLTEEDRKIIRKAVDAFPKLYPLLEQAAACPDYAGGLDYTSGTETFMAALLEQVQKHRSAAFALSERARLRLAEDKHEAALGDAVTILHLARHVEREPMLISHLVACAIRSMGVYSANRALRAGPVSAKARAALDTALAHADDPAGYVQALKSERAYGSELFHTTMCNNWFCRAYANDDHAHYLDLLARQIELAPKTYKEAEPVFQGFRAESKSWRHRVSSLVIPATEKTFAAHVRTRALVRSLRVFNALQAKAPVAGAATPKLDGLGLPAEAITDPYSGGPLLVRPADKEWLVYAVGTNLADDGGKLNNLDDVGVGPVGAGSP